MKVLVTSEVGRGARVTATQVRRAATAMLRALEMPNAELSVLLCDDAAIHVLNRDYRHKDKPTDVLAFAMREGEDGARAGDVLGDVVISLDTAARQADEHAHTLLDEVHTLLAHGLLHLLGWDHRTDAEDRRMRKETARLVASVRAQNAVATPRVRARAK